MDGSDQGKSYRAVLTDGNRRPGARQEFLLLWELHRQHCFPAALEAFGIDSKQIARAKPVLGGRIQPQMDQVDRLLVAPRGTRKSKALRT